eukprot:PhM_4_TR2388/c2_g1_i1/m.10380
MPGRLARNFDNVPVDNRVILQDAVLLVAERWPTAQPDRVYDALVKRFHTNLKQTSANKTVLAELGVYCGQRLAQHVRLVFSSQGTHLFPEICRDADEFLIELERKRLLATKGKDVALRFVHHVSSLNEELPGWARAAHICQTGFQLPSQSPVVGTQGSNEAGQQ